MSVADLILKAAPSSEFRKPTVNANTNRSGNKLTITFNFDNLDRPPLSIARTMMHEMIHAEMKVLIKGTLFFILFVRIPFSCFSQEQKDIVFLFQEQDSSIYKEGNIYHLDSLYFKKMHGSNFGEENIKSLRNKIISIEDFKKEEANKEDFFYDRNYRYYLLIKGEMCQEDSLIRVKRMIIIEEEEIDD